MSKLTPVRRRRSALKPVSPAARTPARPGPAVSISEDASAGTWSRSGAKGAGRGAPGPRRLRTVILAPPSAGDSASPVARSPGRSSSAPATPEHSSGGREQAAYPGGRRPSVRDPSLRQVAGHGLVARIVGQRASAARGEVDRRTHRLELSDGEEVARERHLRRSVVANRCALVGRDTDRWAGPPLQEAARPVAIGDLQQDQRVSPLAARVEQGERRFVAGEPGQRAPRLGTAARADPREQAVAQRRPAREALGEVQRALDGVAVAVG